VEKICFGEELVKTQIVDVLPEIVFGEFFTSLAVIPTEVKAIYSDFLELLNGKGDLLS
jgi:hypothetical protein